MSDALVTNWRKARAIAFFRAFSLMGSEVSVLALVLREKGRGATYVGFLMLAGTASLILLAPFAGWIADRFSTRQILPVTSLLQSLLILSLIFQHNPIALLATIFLSSSCGAIENPTLMAALPTVVTKEDYPKQLAFNQTVYAFAGFLAPAIGGLLVAQTGYRWPFVLDAISFLVLATAPFLLNFNRRATAHESGEKIRASEGMRFIMRNPYLRALATLLGCFLFAAGMLQVAQVFLITQILHGSAFVYGLSGTFFSVGLIAGGVILSKIKVSKESQPRAILLSLVLLLISIFIMALAWHWSVVLFTDLLAGIGVSALNVYVSTAFMTSAPSEMRGRIGSALNATINAGMVGALVISGPLLELIGARKELALGGALGVLVLALFGPRLLKKSEV